MDAQHGEDEILGVVLMQPIALAAMLAIVTPLSWIAWSLVTADRVGFRNIRINLGESATAAGPRLSARDHVQVFAKKLTPGSYEAWLDGQLAGAGRPKEWPLARIVAVKPLMAMAGTAVGLLLFTSQPSGGRFLLWMAMTLIPYFTPDLLIHNRAQKRRTEIRLALPSALDQMLIGVQAGLGFEISMSRAAHNGKGALADELIRTLQDIQVGRSRKEAYLALADRIDVPDLRSFVRSVVQADIYGIAIAGVLKAQAEEMRLKRRQRAEETAMKLPVKMLFPLIFFILPVLFIVILGPSVVSIIETFAD